MDMDCDIVRLVDLLDSWLVPIDYLTRVVPKTIWMRLGSDAKDEILCFLSLATYRFRFIVELTSLNCL